MLRKLFIFAKALGAFVKALVKPHEAVVSFSSHGHSTLKGWERCPEEDVAVGIATVRVHEKPRLALYGYEGPHAGELLPVRAGREFLGPEVGNSVVVTPGTGAAHANFMVDADEQITLSAQSSERGMNFRLNGREGEECALFDYDELELLGNKFVVLDLNLRGVTS
jgi:hypothetical protein